MKPKTREIAQAVGAAVAGATAGYVAGVLTAPESGRQARARIGRRFEDARNNAKHDLAEKVAEVKERLQTAVHSAEGRR